MTFVELLLEAIRLLVRVTSCLFYRSPACFVSIFSTCLCPDRRYWVFLFDQKAAKIKTIPTFESSQQFPQTVVNPLCEHKTHHICFLSTAGSSFGEALVCT